MSLSADLLAYRYQDEILRDLDGHDFIEFRFYKGWQYDRFRLELYRHKEIVGDITLDEIPEGLHNPREVIFDTGFMIETGTASEGDSYYGVVFLTFPRDIQF